MMQFMLEDLLQLSKEEEKLKGCMIDKLIQGAKSKKYIPLKNRQKCGKIA